MWPAHSQFSDKPRSCPFTLPPRLSPFCHHVFSRSLFFCPPSMPLIPVYACVISALMFPPKCCPPSLLFVALSSLQPPLSVTIRCWRVGLLDIHVWDYLEECDVCIWGGYRRGRWVNECLCGGWEGVHESSLPYQRHARLFCPNGNYTAHNCSDHNNKGKKIPYPPKNGWRGIKGKWRGLQLAGAFRLC